MKIIFRRRARGSYSEDPAGSYGTLVRWRRPYSTPSGLRRAADPAAILPSIFVEPTHHVQLRADVIGGLRSGAVILLVELQQPGRHALHLQRRVVFLRLRHRRPA